MALYNDEILASSQEITLARKPSQFFTSESTKEPAVVENLSVENRQTWV